MDAEKNNFPKDKIEKFRSLLELILLALKVVIGAAAAWALID